MSSLRGTFAQVFIVLIIAVGLGIFISGRMSAGRTDTEIKVPVIRTSDEANGYLEKARVLSQGPLDRLEQGEPVTGKERDDLRLASAYLQGVVGYEPTNYPPYLVRAKIRLALEDYEGAVTLALNCIDLAPPPTSNPPVEVVQLVAECHYVASRGLFFMHRYPEAIEAARSAVALVPQSANYRVAGAAAELEINHETIASGLLKDALELDPKNRQALALEKLIQAGRKAPGK